jgi:hypothetical protein
MIRSSAALLLACVSLSLPCAAQIGVAPPVVFMSSSTRFGSITVENGTDQTQEVSVRFRFGYPTSFSLGVMRMEYADSAAARENSCADWLKAFPKKFMLGPRQRQTVRFSVAPPADLPERLYWSRCITSAQPQQDLIDTLHTGVSTRIIFVFEQITAIAYTSGAPRADLVLEGRGMVTDSASIHVRWYARRTGGSPYFGTAVTTLYDQTGKEAASATEALVIYRSMMKRSTFDRSHLHPGTYTAVVRLTPGRTDIPPEQLPATPDVSVRIPIVIP